MWILNLRIKSFQAQTNEYLYILQNLIKIKLFQAQTNVNADEATGVYAGGTGEHLLQALLSEKVQLKVMTFQNLYVLQANFFSSIKSKT